MPVSGKQGRVLATIVFTDAVGFSARMGYDEAATVAMIAGDLKLISGKCDAHGGRVLKNTGDGLLMCFSTAGDAMACALEVQEAFAQAVESQGPGHCLEHRIGIHIGDVYLTENDVLGDGVNIAARLLAEAEPGGVCFSQTVHDVVKNRLGVKATYLGPRELKNIREAVPVYQIVVAAASKQRAGRPIEEGAPSPAPARSAFGAKPLWAAGVAILAVAVGGVMWRYRAADPGVRPTMTATQPTLPAPLASVVDEARSAEINRRAGQWVREMGGAMMVIVDAAYPLQVGKDDKLPDKPFQITSIHLSDPRDVTDAGLENLAGLTGVKELHFYGSSARVSNLKFAASMVKLRILNAGVIRLGDDDMAVLSRFPQLESLQVAGLEITDAGLRYVAGLPELQELMIRGTRASDASIALIAGKLPKLQSLNIIDTAVTNHALESLSRHPALRVLSVSDNQIDGRGLAFLRGAPKLQVLNVSRTPIKGEDLATFAGGFPSLVELEMDSLAIGDGDMNSLASSSNFRAWRRLLVRDTHVSSAGVAILQKLNPDLRVEYQTRVHP